MCIGGFTGFTRTGFVDSAYSELVLVSLFQFVHGASANRPVNFCALDEIRAEFVFAFNDISSDGSTAISDGRIPLKFDHVLVPVDYLG